MWSPMRIERLRCDRARGPVCGDVPRGVAVLPRRDGQLSVTHAERPRAACSHEPTANERRCSWTRRSATVERMTIQRMEHVGIAVDDLEAAKPFFVELGLELQGEGQVEGGWVDRVVGLEGVRVECAMVETPRTATDGSSW